MSKFAALLLAAGFVCSATGQAAAQSMPPDMMGDYDGHMDGPPPVIMLIPPEGTEKPEGLEMPEDPGEAHGVILDAFFGMMDTNGDGLLDLDELAAWARPPHMPMGPEGMHHEGMGPEGMDPGGMGPGPEMMDEMRQRIREELEHEIREQIMREMGEKMGDRREHMHQRIQEMREHEQRMRDDMQRLRDEIARMEEEMRMMDEEGRDMGEHPE